MFNVLSLVVADLQNHKVTITLPEQKEKRELFLIIVKANTSLNEDFIQTFAPDGDAKKFSPLHQKMIDKVFPKKKTDNYFGMFVDDNLQLVFAFNVAFAEYDAKKEKVIYKNMDDLLVEAAPVAIAHKPFIDDDDRFPGRSSFPGGGGMDMRMRYAIPEKEKE